MNVTLAVNDGMAHQRQWADWMESGLRAHGIEPRRVVGRERADTEAVVCWGWGLGSHYREQGHQVLVAERAYLGDRFTWVSLGWNGLNSRATFPVVDDGGARWREHFADLMQPWKQGGDYILLMGQVMGDNSIKHVDIGRWYADAATALSVHGLPVRFRPHPVAVQRNQRMSVPCAPEIGGTLEQALSGAAWVVTYNSNSGVDAVMAGIPAITSDHGAMAWDVTGHDLAERPPMPDREAWGHRMAFTQWLPGEIESGAAWETARTVMTERAAA